MKPNRDGDFEQNMDQLIQLLRKIMKQEPNQGQFSKVQSLFKEQGIHINFCFFNFFPVSDDEIDEFEEICDQFLSDEEKKPEDLSTDLNAEDVDFLRRHGIRY